MTEERARAIVRKVFYANLTMIPDIKDSDVAVQVGRALGTMQKTLEVELEKELIYKESD